MRCSTVLFDLDGTLIDTGPIILRSMRHATRVVLGREIPDDVLLQGVGGAGIVEQMRAIDPGRVDDLVAVYVDHNLPLHAEVEPFPGIVGVLESLQEAGVRLGIVTAKRRRTVEHALEVIPIGGFFDVLVTPDDTTRHKPDPEPLRLALTRLGRDGGDAAYVGDSPFDVRAARAAPMLAVACTWGAVHPRARVAAELPDAIVDSPAELLDVLAV